jgi:hypothetical protein
VGRREGLKKPWNQSGNKSQHMPLFALSSLFNDLIQGREEQQELFSSRYLRRLLTSTVFLGTKSRCWAVSFKV